MKRSVILVASLLLLASNVVHTFAQQRLGLRPGRITIQGRGQTREAEAFCLDRHRIQADEPVPYSKIISGNARARVKIGNQALVSLQQAIDRGLLSITGRAGGGFDSRLSLKFISNTNQPVTIEIDEPVAFGQTSSWISPGALAPLGQRGPAHSSKQLQDEIWQAETYQRRLQVLGYMKGDEGEVTLQNIREGTRNFQKTHGLNSTGVLDHQTKAALDRAEEELTTDFARIGVDVTPRTDTSVQDVTDVIRRYEKYLGKTEAGLMTDALRAHMTEDAAILKQVEDVSDLGTTPASDLSAKDIVPNVVTFQRYRAGTNVIVRRPDGVELWSHFNGKVIRRTKGEKAIEEFDYLSLAGAARNSSDDMHIVQTAAYHPGTKIRVAFGRGEFVEISQDEFSRFLEGESMIAAFDERVAKLNRVGTKRPRILVSRSSLNQGRGGDAGNGTSPIEGLGYEQIDPS